MQPCRQFYTPRDFRLGSGAAVMSQARLGSSSTATRRLLAWLLASAYLLSVADANQHSAADNIYPVKPGQPMTSMPLPSQPSLTAVRAPVDHVGELRGQHAPPTRWTQTVHKDGNIRYTAARYHKALFGFAMSRMKRIQMFTAMVWVTAMFALVVLMFHSPSAPTWDPAGTQSYHVWLRDVQLWLNATNTRLNVTAQAAAIQLALRGQARVFAMTIPAEAITHGAAINGVITDPVTYLLYVLGTRYERLEGERTMTLGNLVLDFQGHRNERIEAILARFDTARHDADSVGAGIHNHYNLARILLRACGITHDQLINLLQPNNGHNNNSTYYSRHNSNNNKLNLLIPL